MDLKQTIQKGPVQRLKRLIAYVKPYKGKLLVSFLLLLITAGLSLVYPVFFGRVIDAAFTDKSLPQLNRNFILLVILFGVQTLFMFFRYYWMAWVGERVVANLRVEVFEHILKMPQSFFHKTRTGEILSRLNDDVNRVQSVVGTDLTMAFRNAITIIGILTILLYTNPKLTCVMLAVVPPIAIIARYWGRKIWRHSQKAQDVLAQASGTAQECIAAMDTVQAFTKESYEMKRYHHYVDDSFKLFAHRDLIRAGFYSMAIFMAFFSIAGIFWLGGRMVVSGEISPGELTQFMLYTIIMAESVGSFANLLSNLSGALGATVRIFEILDQKSDIIDMPGALELPPGSGLVEFDNVSFTYKGRVAATVRHFSLILKPGTVSALVGPSGSGKTTVGRLLLRFFDSQEGEIRVDGYPLQKLKLSSLRRKISVVAQEAPLFNGSIEDNIRYGHLEASQAEIRKAATLAHAEKFINDFPNGYKTIVGERGAKLSGGQRQRIAIARTILRNPDILILDEATNALDAESENIVQSAIDGLQSGRTTLVVAHRLSTIQKADNIIVMDNGQIVETGTHDELMVAGSAYAHLVALQASASANHLHRRT